MLDPVRPIPIADMMTTTDWNASPVGPPEAWPLSLRTIVQTIAVAGAEIVLFWGPDLVAIYNDAYAATIGSKHPHAFGRPASEYWAEMWDDLEPLLRGVYESGETFAARDRPFYIERGGMGETAYFDVSYSAARTDDGSVGGVLCIVCETTERVLAERRLRAHDAELRASEGRTRAQADHLKAVYRALPVGLAVFDAELRYVQVNDRLAELNGIPAEDHIGRTVDEIVPDISDQARSLFARVLAGEAIWGQEIVGPTKAFPDQLSSWRENWVPLRDGSGAVVGIVVSVEDVTAERQAQRAVETLNEVGTALAQEHDLHRLVQIVTDAGVALSGAAFGAFFYNVVDGAGEHYTLYALSGAPRAAFERFPMPRNTAVFAPTFEGSGIVRSDDITKDPRYGHNHPRQGMPDGHLPVCSYLAVPVMARDGEVLGGLFFGHSEPARFAERHETLLGSLAAQAGIAIENARLIQRVRDANETLERRVAERSAALTEAHEALRQAQKMEAMGQLTGGVAHDFNNLLTPIVGSLDLLRNRHAPDERAQRLLDNTLQSAQKATTLVHRLLAFARRQPLQPRAVDMAALVDGMAELIRSTLGPQIKVVVEQAPGVPPALADQNQVEMALLNLSVNARDAMPDGGTLRISLSSASIASGEADLVPGTYVCLSVADSGIGMDAETLARAIEPFFSTKGIGRGTGLGLSMVHGLASQLGGTLALRSVPGLGTNAELWLPVSTNEGKAAESDAPGRAATGSGLVLLIDDEQAVRATATEMLTELGYAVVEADSAAAAIRLLDQGLKPDLLLSDHLMPDMTGTELARAVHDRLPATRTVIMSGYADLESLSPEFAHLAKPFLAADLLDALHAAAEFSPSSRA